MTVVRTRPSVQVVRSMSHTLPRKAGSLQGAPCGGDVSGQTLGSGVGVGSGADVSVGFGVAAIPPSPPPSPPPPWPPSAAPSPPPPWPASAAPPPPPALPRFVPGVTVGVAPGVTVGVGWSFDFQLLQHVARQTTTSLTLPKPGYPFGLRSTHADRPAQHATPSLPSGVMGASYWYMSPVSLVHLGGQTFAFPRP